MQSSICRKMFQINYRFRLYLQLSIDLDFFSKNSIQVEQVKLFRCHSSIMSSVALIYSAVQMSISWLVSELSEINFQEHFMF